MKYEFYSIDDEEKHYIIDEKGLKRLVKELRKDAEKLAKALEQELERVEEPLVNLTKKGFVRCISGRRKAEKCVSDKRAFVERLKKELER